MNFDITKTEEAINKTFPSIVMFIRDANLEEAIVNKYEPQMILREKGFTDASCKVGGMITTHRYIILSNHISNFTEYENGTDWGLYVAQKNSHFKVLDKHSYNGKTCIVILHLPDDTS